MKKITKVQMATIIAILLYIVWEIYIGIWSRTQVGAIIRVDIFIIYPILIALIIISVKQYIKNKRSNHR